ncbi:MAG TPA: GTP pyrophosphokinase [Lachnospiraceae bacterium]|nr:GTP pyrophosphokinase [Lachnospiraceae bacterium]
MQDTKINTSSETQFPELCKDMKQADFVLVYKRAIIKVMQIIEREAEVLEEINHREILSRLTGRIKTPESVERKLLKKGCTVDIKTAVRKIHDIAGVRATCYFIDDVYELSRCLKSNNQLHCIKEKNYILKPKSSGYKSLHLIVEVPILFYETEQWVCVEVQLRTLAMDFWARLDHRLCYKKEIQSTKMEQKNLEEYADIISRVDEQMLSLRKRIDALG